MARDDWTVLCCQPSSEYLAQSELNRLHCSPYLPQYTRLWCPEGRRVMRRRFPLFVGYMFLPRDQFNPDVLHWARGLRRHIMAISDPDGNPLPLRGEVVMALMESEARGLLDETDHAGLSPGQVMVIQGGAAKGLSVILSAVKSRHALTVVAPLFGGCNAQIALSSVH